jgi:glycosyltransferase involved in cell wall biosynthesis
VLIVQSTSSRSAEVEVVRRLLEALPGACERMSQEIEVLLLQGTDGIRREAFDVFSALGNVCVEAFHIGRLGTATTRAQRAMQLSDLAVLGRDCLRLRRLARSFAPDVVYSSQQVWDVRIAAAVCPTPAPARVLHLHYNCGPWLGRRALACLVGAHQVIAISDFVREQAVGLGTLEARAVTVHNPCLRIAAPDRGARAAARRELCDELAIPLDACLIGMAARVSRWKGQLELVRAALLLMDERPDLHLLLAGRPDAWSDVSPEITSLVAAARRKDRVRLLGHRDDMDRFMSAIDVFAHPSREEPFSLAILDAMTYGLPVVAWNEGGPREIIDDGTTGVLVESGSIDGLTAALNRLADDAVLRCEMGARARRHAIERFAPDRTAEAFAEAIVGAAGARIGPAPAAG